MSEKLINYIVIILLSIAVITNLLRLIYLLLQPSFLKKYKFIANLTPSKSQLILYYVIVIIMCVYGLKNKIGYL